MIGILGISANPPHIGHDLIISNIMTSGIFDEFILILSGNRNDKKYVSPYDRINMSELAFRKFREKKFDYIKTKFFIRYDNVYSDNTPSIILLRQLKEEFQQTDIKFIIGSDLIFEKNGKCEIESSWFDGEQLMEEFNFLVIQRNDYPINRKLSSNFEIYDKIFANISSTKIRENIKENIEIEDLVIPSVAEYINKYNLYK